MTEHHRHFGIRFAPLSSQGDAKASVARSPNAAALAINQPARPVLGGSKQLAARPPANTHRNSISLHPLPLGSLVPFSPPLEPLDIREAVKDIIALAFAFLFLGSVGIAFAFGLFVLLFVRT